MCVALAYHDTKGVMPTPIAQGRVGAWASCASEVGVSLAGRSFGVSALFGYFLGKQKVTSANGKRNGLGDKLTMEE